MLHRACAAITPAPFASQQTLFGKIVQPIYVHFRCHCPVSLDARARIWHYHFDNSMMWLRWQGRHQRA
jgi:hypothetical protein